MILVLLGTQKNNFLRLLNKLDDLLENGVINEKVVVQAGATKYNSNKMEIFDYVEKDHMNDLIEKSRFIITHGGVGSITNCLKMGKKVIAVPRLKKYGEHINNHQQQIVEEFTNKKLIIGVNEIEYLAEAIKNIEKFQPNDFVGNNKKILNIITDFIDNN